MAQSSLVDILGVLIGFAAIMFLLSLLVTAIVQFVQSILGMRPGNLRHGVSGLLETVLAQGPPAAGAAPAEAAAPVAPAARAAPPAQPAASAKRIASQALNVARFAPGRDPEKTMQAVFNPLNPLMSWVEPDELIIRLREVGTYLTPVQENTLKQLYGRMEKYLSKRFALHIRYVTIAIALLVAVIFQVSAPHLIQELSTDPQARARALAVSERLLDDNRSAESLQGKKKVVPERALGTLAAKYPELSKKLEEASGGPSRTESLREVALVIDGDPRKDEVLREYERLLDELYSVEVADASRRIKEHASELAMLNIVPFGRGSSFYKDPIRLLGIGVTVILLTLGAPFWYEMLRNLSSLRDALKAKPSKGEQGAA